MATTKKATAKKLRLGDRGTTNGTDWEVSSGNVFADLGFEDAGERLVKAKLASLINHIIEEKSWDQKTAAAKLGTHQPVISDLKRGRLQSITYDRLIEYLTLLGWSIELKVEKSKTPQVTMAFA